MRVVCGIDPGLEGGIAVINDDREVLQLHTMPTIGNEVTGRGLAVVVRQITGLYPNTLFVIEKPGIRPGQSPSSGVKIGRNYGIIEGTLATLEAPYFEITSQAWGKRLPGVNEKDKKKAYKARKERNTKEVIKRFPKANLLATERSKVPHLGLVDALLIAEYGLSLA